MSSTEYPPSTAGCTNPPRLTGTFSKVFAVMVEEETGNRKTKQKTKTAQDVENVTRGGGVVTNDAFSWRGRGRGARDRTRTPVKNTTVIGTGGLLPGVYIWGTFSTWALTSLPLYGEVGGAAAGEREPPIGRAAEPRSSEGKRFVKSFVRGEEQGSHIFTEEKASLRVVPPPLFLSPLLRRVWRCRTELRQQERNSGRARLTHKRVKSGERERPLKSIFSSGIIIGK